MKSKKKKGSKSGLTVTIQKHDRISVLIQTLTKNEHTSNEQVKLYSIQLHIVQKQC